MSKMGNFILDVQERHSNGESPEEIAKSIGVPLRMVKDTIEDSDLDNDWPEPESDF